MTSWLNILRLVDETGYTLAWFKVASREARPVELIADPDGVVFELICLARTGNWWIYKRTGRRDDDPQVGDIPRLRLDHQVNRPREASDDPVAAETLARDPLKPFLVNT